MSQAVRLKSRLKLFLLKQNIKLSACNRKADKNYRKRSKNEHHITLIYCSTHQNCYSFTKKSPDRVTNDLNTKQTNGDSCSGIRSSKPKPIGQIIICFPTITPNTKGRALRKPYFAPVASIIIFAGPGVATWLKANSKK